MVSSNRSVGMMEDGIAGIDRGRRFRGERTPSACVDPSPNLFSSGRFGNLDSLVIGHSSLVISHSLGL